MPWRQSQIPKPGRSCYRAATRKSPKATATRRCKPTSPPCRPGGGFLDPLPPGASKTPGVRHLDIREDEPLDEAQFAEWVSQASLLPGYRM